MSRFAPSYGSDERVRTRDAARGVSRALRAAARPLRQMRIRAGCLRGLDFVWLEITRSCNLTCRHCYVSSGPGLPVVESMARTDWMRVLNDAWKLGCRQAQFIGGEPTLHPDLPRLVRHARAIGFKRIEVFTNATRLTEDLLDCFRTHRVEAASSFYSADPAVHDRITGYEGSFRRTVDGLRALVERRIPLRVGVIRVDQDAGQLREAVRFLRRLGVRSIQTDRVRGIGRGSRLVPGARPASELCGRCWDGKLCIDANGDGFPCVFSRFAPVGNVLSSGLESVVHGARLATFRRRSYLHEL